MPRRSKALEREYMKRWRLKNAEKLKASKKKWYQDHKEQHRAYHRATSPDRLLRKKYGIGLHEKSQILLSQGSACAICESNDPGKKGWVVDHDHTSGHVRGVLCGRCNLALGLWRDDDRILDAAIQYLRKARRNAA